MYEKFATDAGKRFLELPAEPAWRTAINAPAATGNQGLDRLTSLLLSAQIIHSRVISGIRLARNHNRDRNTAKLQTLFFAMLNHAHFLVKNHGKGSLQPRAGAPLSQDQFQAVLGLGSFLYRDLKNAFGSRDLASFESLCLEHFGRQVQDDSDAEDVNLRLRELADGESYLQYYESDVDRKAFKLSFRNGTAWKWDYDESGKSALREYDTRIEGDDVENGGSLYVMDRRGRLYVSGKDQGTAVLKHSSFMGGEGTLAAGTIRIDNGRIKWVSGRSGHYQPKVSQIVLLLERLAAYQVDLSSVLVYRENYTGDKRFIMPGFPHTDYFESVPALDLLRLRQWPGDPAHSNSMRVA